ncbi:hypothetical protein IT570_12650 [Candidatus Sumerlaeota bacterium]|nr:hypothetical protein [Candidatus Sumerlaeota bacterium]
MKRKTILVAVGILAAGVAGVIAAGSLTKSNSDAAQIKTETRTEVAETKSAPSTMPMAGSIVFIDENGNRVQPTAKQMQELRRSTKSVRSTGAPPTVSQADPNDPSKGLVLRNIPPAAAAARINADGTVDARCFDTEADAVKFTEGAEVKAHSHQGEATK